MFLFCSKLARKGGTSQLAWKKWASFCILFIFKKKYFVVFRLSKVVLSWFNHFLKNVLWGALHYSFAIKDKLVLLWIDSCYVLWHNNIPVTIAVSTIYTWLPHSDYKLMASPKGRDRIRDYVGYYLVYSAIAISKLNPRLVK